MEKIRILTVFVFLVIIFGFPWYLKNWIYTGNPIFPTSPKFFNGYYGDPEMSEVWRQYGNPNSPFVYGHYGFGTSLESFIKLPWRITFLGGGFEGYYFTPIYLSFIPLVFLFKERNRLYLLSFCIFYITAWFFQMQQLKFLIPVFGIFGFLVSTNVLNFLSSFSKYAQVLFLSFLIFPTVSSLEVFYSRYPQHFWEKIPVVLKIEDKNSYLFRTLSNHKVVNFMNSHLPEDSVVLSPWELRLFYLDRNYILARGMHQIYIDYRKISSFEDFLGHLKQLGVTHILDHKRRDGFFKDPNCVGTNDAACYIVFSMLDYKYLEKIYEDNDFLLLKINYPKDVVYCQKVNQMNPVLIGDILYKFGKLDMARQQYEKGAKLGFKDARVKMRQIDSMSCVERGDFYLGKSKEFKNDYFFKAALDEYLLALKEVNQNISQKRIIAQRIDNFYTTAMSIAPHIWGCLPRIKVE